MFVSHSFDSLVLFVWAGARGEGWRPGLHTQMQGQPRAAASSPGTRHRRHCPLIAATGNGTTSLLGGGRGGRGGILLEGHT